MNKFKLLSYQPFSLYDNGGGSRILRRLYEGNEPLVISLCLVSKKKKEIDIKGIQIKEIQVEEIVVLRKWMRWKLRDFVFFIRRLMKGALIKKILKEYQKLDFEVLHIVDHGSLSGILVNFAIKSNKKIWVSFHDHYLSNGGSFGNTKYLWNNSDRRLVISEELGQEYQRIFNDLPYEIITDGVKIEEISVPKSIKLKNEYTLYFAGLLHIDYLPIFEVLADALDELSLEGLNLSLVLRGTQEVKFLENRKFKLEYRPMILDDKILKSELEEADILYLPLKFSSPEFYLFSLSTKMVGYLAASGTILFHGPSDSAACKFLLKTNSAFICNSLDKAKLKELIINMTEESFSFSYNAKKYLKISLLLEEKQRLFWSDILIK